MVFESTRGYGFLVEPGRRTVFGQRVRHFHTCTLHTREHGAECLLAALPSLRPRSFDKRQLMGNVLSMAVCEYGHPVTFAIPLEVDGVALHDVNQVWESAAPEPARPRHLSAS